MSSIQPLPVFICVLIVLQDVASAQARDTLHPCSSRIHRFRGSSGSQARPINDSAMLVERDKQLYFRPLLCNEHSFLSLKWSWHAFTSWLSCFYVMALIPQASVLSSKSDDGPKDGSKAGQAKNTRRGSMVNRRAGLKAALHVSMRTPKPQSLPSYLVKVLLSLVQARLEAQVRGGTSIIDSSLYGSIHRHRSRPTSAITCWFVPSYRNSRFRCETAPFVFFCGTRPSTAVPMPYNHGANQDPAICMPAFNWFIAICFDSCFYVF